MAFTLEWAGNPRDEPDMDLLRQNLADALGPNVELSKNGRFYEVAGPRTCLNHVRETLDSMLAEASVCEDCNLCTDDFCIEEA